MKYKTNHRKLMSHIKGYHKFNDFIDNINYFGKYRKLNKYNHYILFRIIESTEHWKYPDGSSKIVDAYYIVNDLGIVTMRDSD